MTPVFRNVLSKAFAIIVVFFLLSCACAQQPATRDALAGADWTFSADGGKAFALKSLPTKAGTPADVVARATFRIDDLAAVGGVWLAGGRGSVPAKCTINGKPVEPPLAGMSYAAIPLDPVKYLVNGQNVLVAACTVPGTGQPVEPAQIAPRLEIGPPAMLVIRTGPAVGAVGTDYFTVTCRTNIAAEVVVAGKPTDPAGPESSAKSPRGFYHRVKVALPTGTKQFTYTVTAVAGDVKKTAGPFTVRMPYSNGKSFRFVATGDCRTHSERWAAVADAVHKSEAELVVFTGDLVSSGTSDEIWDGEFFTPARDLVSTTAFYPVMGNHENDAPAFVELFYTPSEEGRRKDWAQTVGDVTFIGIDGTQRWEAASNKVEWLEGVLKASKAKYLFFLTHYPAWTSGSHAKIMEPGMLASRTVIMPLLVKYRATAMIVGHDHNYERSELPPDKGVTCITAGGAGAPLRGQVRNAAQFNPYSKVFFPGLNYCVFEVTDKDCRMKAYGFTPEGIKVVDETAFKPREAGR